MHIIGGIILTNWTRLCQTLATRGTQWAVDITAATHQQYFLQFSRFVLHKQCLPSSILMLMLTQCARVTLALSLALESRCSTPFHPQCPFISCLSNGGGREWVMGDDILSMTSQSNDSQLIHCFALTNIEPLYLSFPFSRPLGPQIDFLLRVFPVRWRDAVTAGFEFVDHTATLGKVINYSYVRDMYTYV